MAQNFGNAVNLNKNELQNAVIQVLASDPGSPSNGQVWVNSTDWTLKVRLNGATVSLGRLDQLTAPAGSVNMNNQRLTNLPTPGAGTDPATRDYVDAAVLGMDLREDVRAASLANVTLASAAANGSSFGGVTLATGDRIALLGQAAGAENGLYTVNASGAPTRATDFDTAADMDRGVLIPVLSGTNSGLYMHTTPGTITVGTTALSFLKLGPSAGGSSKFAADIGNGSLTTIDVVHNLGSTDVDVALYDKLSPANRWFTDTSIVDANTVRFVFAAAPASNQFRAVIWS